MYRVMQTPATSRPFSIDSRPARRRSVISLTPLIDVVFILLVFFMLASSFLDWRSISLDTVLPSTTSQPTTEPRPLLLSVGTAQLKLNGEVMTMAAMLPILQRRLDVDPGAVVRVQPLGDTTLQTVIAVLDQLQLAGITQLSMIRDRSWNAAGTPSPTAQD